MNNAETLALNEHDIASHAELLRDVPFFAKLSELERLHLSKLLEIKELQAGETVFLVGEPGDALYIVKRGVVELFLRDNAGTKISLKNVEAHGIFGEVSLLDKGPRSASACTLEPTILLKLDHEHLEQFLQQAPHALSEMLCVLGERLRHADALLRGQAVVNTNQVIEQKLGIFHRMASFVADFSGSLAFLIINLCFFCIWIAWNCSLIPGLEAFDPYPFSFLTMFVSLEAIVLSILVLLSQNLQGAREKVRNDIEYEVNLRAELEVTHLHTKVDLLHAELLSRLHQIERKIPGR